ncbi:MAG: glycogen-binding domain-containing protein [Spirochaetaceae bacterium]|jgi:hypothetical protein|nr:glycogen-binding domain-containing protein [Spirochaetaceae bacterium]
MKTITAVLLLSVIIGTSDAIDTESYQFIDHLLGITEPGRPDMFEDGIIFTASSSYTRVGIAFAHEGFAQVHWFRKLVHPGEASPDKKEKSPIYIDSGLLFYVLTLPPEMRTVEYRMIINGLWTTDPLNPISRIDPESGIAHSIVLVPGSPQKDILLTPPPGCFVFRYSGISGETITVAGNFNGWDPFMYELQETSPGRYALTLPLPSGTYQYVFFRWGERFPDPANRQRVYTKDGKIASVAVVE